MSVAAEQDEDCVGSEDAQKRINGLDRAFSKTTFVEGKDDLAAPAADHDLAVAVRPIEFEQEASQEPSDEVVSRNEFQPYPIFRLCDITPSLANNYLIKGLIDRETLIVMYGRSGSGKSFLATDLGLAIASGQPWRGNRTRRGRVVYVAAEGAKGMKNRLYGASQNLACSSVAAVDFHLVPSVVRLTEDEPDVDRFVRTILDKCGNGADLVIIDTLSRSMTGDENTSKDMMAAVAAATVRRRRRRKR